MRLTQTMRNTGPGAWAARSPGRPRYHRCVAPAEPESVRTPPKLGKPSPGYDTMHTSFLFAAPLVLMSSVTAQYLVVDLHPGTPDSAPASLTVLDRTLYFTADDGVNG